MAPATHAAMAAVSTKLVEAPAAITPIATLATETIPSLAPSTAARSHPARCPLWRTLVAVPTVPSLSTDVTNTWDAALRYPENLVVKSLEIAPKSLIDTIDQDHS
jgi:hypothetical protein